MFSTHRRGLRVAVGLWTAAGLLLAGSAAAQAAEAAPAADDLGPQVVRTDEGPTGYSVTFRYDAPDDVESVQIYGEWTFSQPETVTCQGCGDARTGAEWQPGDILAGPWTSQPMTLGEDGIWTFTTPLPSGTFSYGFLHDCESPTGSGCTRYPDPANAGWNDDFPTQSQQTLSQVYVPHNPLFETADYSAQEPLSDDEMGTLEHLTYASPRSLDPVGEHYVSVYLPRGYDADRTTPYPTLYLSHGGGGTDTDWFTQGAAQNIIQSSIDAGDAEDMVVVATNFNGFNSPGTSTSSTQAVTGYIDDVQNNVIPLIEGRYNVSTSSAERAFAGLSAGGFRALNIIFAQPDLFEYYGIWSSGSSSPIPAGEQLDQFATINGTVHNGVGLQDWQNNIYPLSIERAEAIRTSGVDLVEYNVDGIHSWDVWRQLLDDFVDEVAFKKSFVTDVQYAFDAAEDAGDIRRTEANVLGKHLDIAERLYEHDNDEQAVAQLERFIERLENPSTGSSTDPETADELISLAQEAVTTLS